MQMAPPTAENVERSVKSMKRGKAVGPDGISAEVLKSGGFAIVIQITSLLQRIWQYCYWPIQWRGGRLCELLRKATSVTLIIIEACSLAIILQK